MTKLIGVEGRAEARKAEKSVAIEKGLVCFKQYFDCDAQPPSSNEFNEKWLRVISIIGEHCKSKKVYRAVYNTLQNLVKKLCLTKNWKVEIPTVLATHRQTPPLKNKVWVQNAWSIDKSYSNWFREIGKSNLLSSAAELYQATMLSFILHSGHASLSKVNAFNLFLNDPKEVLKGLNDVVYIPLNIEDKSLSSNVYVNGEAITLLNCYLSELTYALLQKWLRINKVSWKHPDSDSEIYNKIMYMDFMNKNEMPKNLDKFCLSAVFVTEKITKKPLTSAMLEFAINHNKSYSLPQANLSRLMTPAVNSVLPAKLQEYSQKHIISKADNTAFGFIPTTGFWNKLLLIIREKSNSQQKLKLEGLLAEHLALQEFMLISWYLLKINTCKPSTIKRYHNVISRCWLKIASTKHFFDMEIDEIEDLYLEELNKKRTIKTQQYFTDRLLDLHKYAVSKKILPAIEQNSVFFHSVKSHVRAGFVDEVLFSALLTQCLSVTDISEQDKLALQVILILSYRAGLRLTECLKLQKKDLEPSTDGWLSVRPNKHADNKTLSSLRKVPLNRLLLSHEMDLIKQYLQISRLQNNKESSLIFTFGSQLGSMLPRSTISSFVTRRLRALSGCDHFVFHHLRHSALTRLQMMIELPIVRSELKHIVPYSQKQRDFIIRKVCGENIANKYEALAAAAGHSAVQVTFQYYFHLSDYILAEHCSELDIPLSSKQAFTLGLGSKSVCQSYFNQFDELNPHHFKSYLNRKHEPKLLPSSATSNGEVRAVVRFKNTASIPLCYSILQKIEDGADVESTAFQYGISPELIDRWISRAEMIRDNFYTTHKNTPRHVSSVRANNLLPGSIRRQSEQAYCDKLAKKISTHFSTNKLLLREIMTYVLNNRYIAHSGITFNSPDKLNWFINSLKSVIPVSHWRAVTYRVENSINAEHWKIELQGIEQIIGEVGTPSGRKAKGTVRLEFISPDEKALINGNNLTKYSSHVFVYLMHMLGIMMGGVVNK